MAYVKVTVHIIQVKVFHLHVLHICMCVYMICMHVCINVWSKRYRWNCMYDLYVCMCVYLFMFLCVYDECL